MAIQISEAVDLDQDDARLVHQWGGVRQLRHRAREVVLVGRLQRALLQHAWEQAEDAGLVAADGKMGSRTRQVLDAYNAQVVLDGRSGDVVDLGPELVAIFQASAANEAAPTADLPEDPPDDEGAVGAVGASPNETRRHHHHHHEHDLPVPCEPEPTRRRDSSSLGSERTDGDESLPLHEREPDL
jgi:hypothetical protein